MGAGRSRLYGNTKGAAGKISNAALKHANVGTFIRTPEGLRIKSGGHGQDNIEKLKKLGIEYNIVKTFSNGVRLGNIPTHRIRFKQKGTGQAWFPKEWTENDIRRAGEHVASLKGNQISKDGEEISGFWKGVRVGVIRRNGRIQTVYPCYDQSKKGER